MRRLLDSLHRPSSVSRIIKQLYGTTCAICGREGFPKRDGAKYAEVHHVEEVSSNSPGVLGSQNMIVVCATCHRMLHYADVEVDQTASGWLITINGHQHRLKRLATEKGSSHLRCRPLHVSGPTCSEMAETQSGDRQNRGNLGQQGTQERRVPLVIWPDSYTGKSVGPQTRLSRTGLVFQRGSGDNEARGLSRGLPTCSLY